MDKLIFTFFMLVIAFSASGQNHLLIKKGSNYYFQGETYKCEELEAVYKLHQPSLDHYLAGRKHKQKASQSGWTGFGFMTGGFLFTILGIGNSAYQDRGGSNIVTYVGVISFLSGLVMEVVAIGLSADGNYKLKKARNTFNDEMLNRHGYKSEVKLILGTTGNGVGLVYQF